METISKIGFGGGCHWCTEAVFQSLKGVARVEQGFIAAKSVLGSFSEAVVVHYDEQIITLNDLVLIHVYTHKSTKNHSMRTKYRSAVYVFDKITELAARSALADAQLDFKEGLITQVLPFGDFKSSQERFHNYYRTDPQRPFCKTYISPKLKVLKKRFPNSICPNLNSELHSAS